MAEIKKIATIVETKAVLVLNDAEIGALDALAGYGLKVFLEVFYKHLGEHYMRPHEAGLASLFEAVQGCKGMAEAAKECREFLYLAEQDRRGAPQVIRSAAWKLSDELNGKA